MHDGEMRRRGGCEVAGFVLSSHREGQTAEQSVVKAGAPPFY